MYSNNMNFNENGFDVSFFNSSIFILIFYYYISTDIISKCVKLCLDISS